MTALDIINKKTDQRKLLAIDGGGIRGMMAIGVLEEIEHRLKAKLRKGDDFTLSDYFDYIAGTSTGAIIAACLSWGMSVQQIKAFYEEKGPDMFKYGFFPNLIMNASILPFTLRRQLIKIFSAPFKDENLQEILSTVFHENGDPALLGTDNLKTLLMLVLRNATTDSPWPLSNNPNAKYNQRSRPNCNLNYPLWQLIRASTAAPTFFPPESFKIDPDKKPHIFVDGGITPYNNPAFKLFLMATVDRYRLQWPTGEDKMLLVSIGTGTTVKADENLQFKNMSVLYNAQTIPTALMFAGQNEQDILCRTFGKCLYGPELDRELDYPPEAKSGDLPDLMEHSIGLLKEKLFTYVRYDSQLDEESLDNLGISGLSTTEIDNLQLMDLVNDANLNNLYAIGKAIAQKHLKPKHFEKFLTSKAPEES